MKLIQGVFDVLRQIGGGAHRRLYLLTDEQAESSGTLRAQFERDTGYPFTPRNSRRVRLELLDQADAMIVIRTRLSESSAFELAYNIFGGHQIPVFFAIWRDAPLETTLLRDLDEFVPIRYVTFSDARELREPLKNFLDECVRVHHDDLQEAGSVRSTSTNEEAVLART